MQRDTVRELEVEGIGLVRQASGRRPHLDLRHFEDRSTDSLQVGEVQLVDGAVLSFPDVVGDYLDGSNVHNCMGHHKLFKSQGERLRQLSDEGAVERACQSDLVAESPAGDHLRESSLMRNCTRRSLELNGLRNVDNDVGCRVQIQSRLHVYLEVSERLHELTARCESSIHRSWPLLGAGHDEIVVKNNVAVFKISVNILSHVDLERFSIVNEWLVEHLRQAEDAEGDLAVVVLAGHQFD